ncbi:MAG: creatininase family protein [Candidatus Bathyarchaeia archaeon]
MQSKVRYEELLPHEMEEIMRNKPIAYLPLGTLEWHSFHLALGNDAVKAYELCLRVAEKAGGVVIPATYWAIGGMPHPWTTRFDASLIERLFYAIFEQMAHVGFKVVIAITGHYGIEQFYTLKKAASEFMYKSNLMIAPLPEYEVAFEKGYRGDHAAKWETSILWALRPELVDMSRLSKNLEEPLEGVGGEDPRIHASRELGEEVVSHMVDRLSELALRLLRKTSGLDRSRFIRALNIQVRILKRVLESPREDRWAVIRTEEYERFVDTLWRGNYIKAIQEGEAILSGIGRLTSS